MGIQFKIYCGFLTALICALAWPCQAAPATSSQGAAVAAAFEPLAHPSPPCALTWGAVVVDLRTAETLYEHDADQLFTPASNMKIVTAAAVLRVLHEDHRFRTRVLRRGEVDADGTLHGDLVLSGGGDPSLDQAGLQQLAQAVHDAGLRRIAGRLLCDDYSQIRVRYGTGWAWDDQAETWDAPLGALSVDENCAEGGPPDGERAPVHDPVQNAAIRFNLCLQTTGVAPSALFEEAPSLAEDVSIAVHDSPPLAELVRKMLKESDNFYAEQFVRGLGAGPKPDDGLDVVQGVVYSWGLTVGSYRQVDGSGLSRMDLISPRQLVWVLQANVGQAAFVSGLPVAGVDGTLKHRLAGTPLQGHVLAKTGSMTGVSSLSGYVCDDTGKPRWAFSILENGFVVKDSAVKGAEDAVLMRLWHVLKSAPTARR
jgi:D-alanyl-D-alanine carboxypeptidase/D-alanyl-D-alanine-endopeptidase (penicillin-binding protein 4)